MIMVYVPAGEFQMGSDLERYEEADDDKFPQHVVSLDTFWIDQTEVTVTMFRTFVEGTGCLTTAEEEGWGYTWVEGQGWEEVEGADWQHPFGPDSTAQGDHPVVLVRWHDAQAYCTWAEAQLPTEAEWEYAARGPEAPLYPWGDKFDCSRGNFDDETELDGYVMPGAEEGCDGYVMMAPVRSFPSGASWVGALDLSGNVWEWVTG